MEQVAQWGFAGSILEIFKIPLEKALSNLVWSQRWPALDKRLDGWLPEWLCNSPCLSETLNILWCFVQGSQKCNSRCQRVRICREIYSCAKGGGFNLVFRKKVHTFSSPYPPLPLNSSGSRSLELIFIPVVSSCLKFFHSSMLRAKQGKWGDMAERADLVLIWRQECQDGPWHFGLSD